jgi:autotransporter-associated beta strand protein
LLSSPAGAPSAPAALVSVGPFVAGSQTETAHVTIAFSGKPALTALGSGVAVHLGGEQTWESAGDPVVPVHSTSIVLPPGMQISSVAVTSLSPAVVLGQGVELAAAPAALTSDVSNPPAQQPSLVTSSFPAGGPVTFSTYRVDGYALGSLCVFPVEYDAGTGDLNFFSQIGFDVTVAASPAGDGTLPVRDCAADRQRVAGLVANPDAIQQYASAVQGENNAAATNVPLQGSSEPPASPLNGTSYQYVLITSSELAGSFQPLVDEKILRGLTATLVTTETIYANYTGTETNDYADKIRSFIRYAYTNWGTQWVLLGGDPALVPVREVYASADSYVDDSMPSDMYYACLDGSWNSNGNTLWGEADDGAKGGGVDLAPDVAVGRALVSTPAEVNNFVEKTIQYETTSDPNANTALWLGEQLDSTTWGSTSGQAISDQVISNNWNLTTLYDTPTCTWSASTLISDLDASPDLVNSLGHASAAMDSRLGPADVAGLTNQFPYFIYSQGCDSGAFDQIPNIAKQELVSTGAAVGAVMNANLGWYFSGDTPGGNYFYALQFWDAVFNRGETRMGDANNQSKLDNLFRVNPTGLYRWIQLETNLLGDPEVALQVGNQAEIHGSVWQDTNYNGVHDAGEPGLVGESVFLDMNGNGIQDTAAVNCTSSGAPQPIPDATDTANGIVNGTITSALATSGLPGLISHVSVTLSITHTCDSNLEVYLISPSGTKLLLFSGVGDGGVNFTSTTLDDSAATAIASASAPFTGTFQPQVPLAKIVGENPNGTWTLQVSDTSPGNTGTLQNWSLQVTAAEPGAATAADGSYAISHLPPGTYTLRHALQSGWVNTDPASGTLTVTVGNVDIVQNVDFLAAPYLPPVAANSTWSTGENVSLSIPAAGVLLDDTDPEGWPLTAALATGPAHGSVVLNLDGSFLYAPAAGYTGPDSFTYCANDGVANSAAATVSITVVGLHTMTWQGPASGNWTAAGQWTGSPPAYPDTTANVVVDTPDAVQVNSAQAANSLQISNGGEVAIAPGGSLTITTDTGITASGTLNVDANGAFTTGGTLTLDTGGSVSGGSVSAAAFQFNDGTAIANLTGPGSLTKDTSGTVTLSGTNRYTGGTTVNEGLLVINNGQAIPSGSLLLVGPDGSVVLGNPAYSELGLLPGGGSGSGTVVLGSGSGSAIELAAAPAATPAAASAGTEVAVPAPVSAPATETSAVRQSGPLAMSTVGVLTAAPPVFVATSQTSMWAALAGGIVTRHADVLSSETWPPSPNEARWLDELPSLQGRVRPAWKPDCVADAVGIVFANHGRW